LNHFDEGFALARFLGHRNQVIRCVQARGSNEQDEKRNVAIFHIDGASGRLEKRFSDSTASQAAKARLKTA
jgi:hypothetical protein